MSIFEITKALTDPALYVSIGLFSLIPILYYFFSDEKDKLKEYIKKGFWQTFGAILCVIMFYLLLCLIFGIIALYNVN